jgi:electron transfer flavoprotein beta subunit
MGADRAVLVSDDAAAGSDLLATGRVLAAALERERPDLVLFGQQSSDSDGAVLWATVADRLRLPVISQAAELAVADGKATVKRQTEFGYERIEAPLPAVIAVSRPRPRRGARRRGGIEDRGAGARAPAGQGRGQKGR